MSDDFKFELFVQSDELLPVKQLIGEGITIKLQQKERAARVWFGYIEKIIFEQHTSKWCKQYRIYVCSSLGLLKHQCVNQVYTSISWISAIESIARSHHINLKWTKLFKTYEAKPFVTQYQKDTYTFWQMLINKAGLGYYVEHAPDQHHLVIFDDEAVLPYRPGDFKEGLQRITETIEGVKKYKLTSAEDTLTSGLSYTSQVCGQSVIITKIMHEAYDYSQVREIKMQSAQQPYQNTFEAVPSHVLLNKKIDDYAEELTGFQRGYVIGNESNQPFVYRHAEAKMNLHWNICQARPETPLSWVKVAQLWAGFGHGLQFLPRVNDEVVVHFNQGNIDQPIITGSCYNALSMPIFSLPSNKAKSGFLSRSLSDRGYHKFYVDDAPNGQCIVMQAFRHWHHQVEKYQSNQIQGDSEIKICASFKLTASQVFHQAKQYIEINAGSSGIKITPNKITLSASRVSFEKM